MDVKLMMMMMMIHAQNVKIIQVKKTQTEVSMLKVWKIFDNNVLPDQIQMYK